MIVKLIVSFILALSLAASVSSWPVWKRLKDPEAFSYMWGFAIWGVGVYILGLINVEEILDYLGLYRALEYSIFAGITYFLLNVPAKRVRWISIARTALFVAFIVSILGIFPFYKWWHIEYTSKKLFLLEFWGERLLIGLWLATTILATAAFWDGQMPQRTLFTVVYFIMFVRRLLFQPSSIYTASYIVETALFAYAGFDVVGSALKYFQLSLDRTKREVDHILSLIGRIGAVVSESLDLNHVAEVAISSICEVVRADAGAIFVYDKVAKNLKVAAVSGVFPPLLETPAYVATREKFLLEKFKSDVIPLGETPVGMVASSLQPLIIADALKDSRVYQAAPGVVDIKTMLVYPLLIQKDLVGVLALINKLGGPFDEADLRTVRILSEVSSLSLRSIQLYNEVLDKQRAEHELQVAASIQRALLPESAPEVSGFQLAFYFNPAKGVGGDYYDFVTLKNGKIGVAMADVAGKGVPAALVMVMIRSILRTLASSVEEPSRLVSLLNNILSEELTAERYATMFYFVYEKTLEGAQIKFTNAGHGPMLLFRGDEVKQLDTDGLPVGIMANTFYGEGAETVLPGDVFILYTDGITEAMNEQKELFGIERLLRVVRANLSLSAEGIRDRIIEEVNKFVGEAPQHDDQTLVVAKAI